MKKILLVAALFAASFTVNALTKTWNFAQSADIETANATVSGFTLGTVTSGTTTQYDCPASTTGTLICAEWPEITFGYTCGSTAKTGIIQFKNSGGVIFNGSNVTLTITGLSVGDTISMSAAAKGSTIPTVSVTGGTQTISPTYVAKSSSSDYTFVSSQFVATSSTFVISQTGGIYIATISSITPTSTSAIESVSADKGAIVSTTYYDITGREVSENATGLILKKVTYENGSSGIIKSIVKK